MKIYVLGVGNAFSFKNYNTSFIVQTDGFNLAIECPHPYLKILNEAPESFPSINSIDDFLITHLHSDHCSGLEIVSFYKKYIENKITNLYMKWNDKENHAMMASIGIGTNIKNNTEIENDVYDFFEYMFLSQSNSKNCGPFNIKCMVNKHYIPSIGILISDGKKTFGYSGDTSFSIALINFLDQADIIFHEVGLGEGHTQIEQLETLPQKIKDKIHLVHYSDSFRSDSFKLVENYQVYEVEW